VVIELDQMYWNFVIATSKAYWAAITSLFAKQAFVRSILNANRRALDVGLPQYISPIVQWDSGRPAADRLAWILCVDGFFKTSDPDQRASLALR
jgi:hypothetical protein